MRRRLWSCIGEEVALWVYGIDRTGRGDQSRSDKVLQRVFDYFCWNFPIFWPRSTVPIFCKSVYLYNILIAISLIFQLRILITSFDLQNVVLTMNKANIGLTIDGVIFISFHFSGRRRSLPLYRIFYVLCEGNKVCVLSVCGTCYKVLISFEDWGKS